MTIGQASIELVAKCPYGKESRMVELGAFGYRCVAPCDTPCSLAETYAEEDIEDEEELSVTQGSEMKSEKEVQKVLELLEECMEDADWKEYWETVSVQMDVLQWVLGKRPSIWD